MSTKLNLRIWLPVMLIAGLVVYSAPEGEGQVVQIASKASAVKDINVATSSNLVRSAPTSSATVSLIEIRSRENTTEVTQVFQQQIWTPPQPKRIEKPITATLQVEAPPAPQAPPLPFRYLGRYLEADQTTIFLAHNDQNLALKVGETFAINYKLDEVKANALIFTFLPLNQKQNMDIGSAP
jgi:hypothetical protein